MIIGETKLQILIFSGTMRLILILVTSGGQAKRTRNDSETSDASSVMSTRKETSRSGQILLDLKIDFWQNLHKNWSRLRSDPGWGENFNPWANNGQTSSESEVKSESSEDSSAKKLKTHISKKEKKQLEKLEAEEIARQRQSDQI